MFRPSVVVEAVPPGATGPAVMSAEDVELV
jgi:hypothetical protein